MSEKSGTSFKMAHYGLDGRGWILDNVIECLPRSTEPPVQ